MSVHTGKIHSGSAQIYYELHSNQKEKTLVLLHGNAESSERFKKHAEILGEYFNILLIDSRGHGLSSMGDGSLSLDKMAVDLENVLNALGLTKVHILGFSDGANIAMIFTPKNNELVDKLVLVGGNLEYGGFTLQTKALVAIGYFLAWINMKVDKTNRINCEYYYLMFKEPHLKPNYINKIQAKTLVMAGDKDMISRSHTDLIVNSIKNGILKIYKGDHFYIYRQPEEFCKTVIDFLTEE
ncbi:MAG: alpha/beta hydrolase [Firmicutes bacterium]|nr:alpha/beta hydrolase [Bacillota bacterium]